MSAYELHDLLGSTRDLIADTWNLFLVVHLAIAAGLLARRRTGLGVKALIAVPVYGGFLYFNYHAQLDNYSYSASILMTLHAEHPEIADMSRTFEPGWVLPYLVPIYLVTAACMVLLLLTEIRWPRRRPAPRPAPAE